LIFDPETATMRVLFAGFVAWCGQATTDIKLSASTFESFSTAFTFNGDYLSMGLHRTLDSVKASGTLQFDMKSKKIKATAVMSADITDRDGTKVTKFNSTISQIVLIDAANLKIHGYVNKSAGMSGGKPVAASTLCQTVAFQSQTTQMASYLTSARLSSAVMMANAMLNMMPHSTSKGVTSFLKKSGTESVWIMINDTTSVPSELVWSKGEQLAVLVFDSWGSSSGDLSAPACTPGVSELDEEFTEGLLGLTDIVGLLEVHPAISEMLYGPRQDDDFGFCTLVTVFCMSGISGAALVLAFAKLSARRNYKSSPLLAAV